MKSITSTNVAINAPRQNLLLWFLFCVITGLWLSAYLLTSLHASNGVVLMPVDDAYIHFQYARQIAAGEPYVYNPGLPPSSGATSFLYPYILAVGYLLGFVDMSLGIWAMILGAFALLLSTQLLYRLAIEHSLPVFYSLGISLLFLLNGYVVWHFMSGMETGYTVLFVLLTFYSFTSKRLHLFTTSAILLALIRPEGSIMAVIAAGLYVLRASLDLPSANLLRRIRIAIQTHWIILFILLALFVQPLVNYVLTGSFSSTGGQSKSLFGMIPFYVDEVIRRVFSNFTQMIQETLLGLGSSGIWYLAPFMGLIVLILVVKQLYKRKEVFPLLLFLIWGVVVFGAISTLDTAFWHFKRYQLPVLVLMFPALILTVNAYKKSILWRYLLIVFLGFSLWIGLNFREYHEMNVRSVFQQPYSMALWLQNNTEPDAIVAVHDVGIMRYLGGRTTVDMVGLTTDGAANYWRNGPGSTGEFLMYYEPHVDYIAAYTTTRGLGYLADTSLYGTLLAGFEAEYDARYNVALGAPFQGIYTNDTELMPKAKIHNHNIRSQIEASLELISEIDVAYLESEQNAAYEWFNIQHYPGFATEFYEFSTVGCTEDCDLPDGGRKITGHERFSFNFADEEVREQYLLVTRVHPFSAGKIEIYVNDVLADIQWIPAIPGNWLEIFTVLPNHDLSPQLDIEIMSVFETGEYAPYFHSLYAWDTEYVPIPDNYIASFQNGQIILSDFELAQTEQELLLTVDWWSDGTAIGDWVTYVHIYDDPEAPPIAQKDIRSFGGGIPPGNWLPGQFSEQFTVDLMHIDSGRYLVGIGFYDPVTNERMPLVLADGHTTETFHDAVNQRLFLQEIIVSK